MAYSNPPLLSTVDAALHDWPAVDDGNKGAWTGFHVIEELAPHPPGFRYVE